tara:strand:- start:1018 stop:1224 length:207 start_codon:yes stop_codon:yes gene_type:complete
MHSIKDTLSDCDNCVQKNTLVRVPSHFMLSQEQHQESKAGALVKEKIEEFKEDLNREKERLSSEGYKV